jgi:hypothetical protein
VFDFKDCKSAGKALTIFLQILQSNILYGGPTALCCSFHFLHCLRTCYASFENLYSLAEAPVHLSKIIL